MGFERYQYICLNIINNNNIHGGLILNSYFLCIYLNELFIIHIEFENFSDFYQMYSKFLAIVSQYVSHPPYFLVSTHPFYP